MKKTLVFAVTSAVLLTSSFAHAKTEQAILAGGCFWCMESDFEKLEGVTDVLSGFTGGEIKNPTYNGIIAAITKPFWLPTTLTY